MSLGSLSGSLKQQIEDGSGAYEWQRRDFLFDLDAGRLTNSDDTRAISLDGALYAKAWSIHSAAVGYGFDIVWSTGDIVSFIARAQEDCTAWVNAVNSSIKFNNSDAQGNPSSGDLLDEILDKNLPLASKAQQEPAVKPPLPASYTSSNGRGESGNDQSSHRRSRSHSPISEMSETMNHKISRNDGVLNASSIGSIGSMPSPNRPTWAERSPTREQDRSGAGAEHATYQAPHNMASHPNNSGRGVGNTSATPTSGAYNISKEGDVEMENFRLQQKCMRLHAKAEREAMDAQIAREQLDKLQQEFDARSTQHARDLSAAREKEELAISQAKADVEMKVLRASNENAAFHEEAMKMEKEQSAREITCLKEDLEAERKRFSALLKEETTAKKRAEDHEFSLQQEITTLKEKLQRSEAEVHRLHNVHRSDSANWERERKLVRQESDDFLKKVEKERLDNATQSQMQIRSKLSELQLKFDSRLQEAELLIKETARQEHEGLRIKDIAVLEKRYEKEIQLARTEEKKARAREVENLKAIFRSDERQTAEDLAQLEQLHTERVRRLESQVEALNSKLIAAEQVAQNATELANKGSVEVRKQAAEHVKQAKAAMKKADGLAEQLHKAHQEIQECRVRESSYRDQLSKSLEDNRVQRAELLEAKKQATEAAAEAFQYKKMSVDHGTDGNATALHVARNEITFLESELEKARADNHALQVSANRHEKLLYGAIGSAAPKGTLMKAMPTRVANASVPPTPTRGRTPVTTPSSTPLSSARNTPAKRQASSSHKGSRAPSPNIPRHGGLITGGIAGGMSGIISAGSGGNSSIGGISDAARVYLEHDKEHASLAAAKSFVHSMAAIEKQKKNKVPPKKKPQVRGTFGTGNRFK